jgi:hypothetical protein
MKENELDDNEINYIDRNINEYVPINDKEKKDSENVENEYAIYINKMKFDWP